MKNERRTSEEGREGKRKKDTMKQSIKEGRENKKKVGNKEATRKERRELQAKTKKKDGKGLKEGHRELRWENRKEASKQQEKTD